MIIALFTGLFGSIQTSASSQYKPLLEYLIKSELSFLKKFIYFNEINLANYAQACLVKAIADIAKSNINTNLLLHFIMNIPKSNDLICLGFEICF